ncbi:MAG: GGDEF domain-containing protein [Pseudomonadota bacterium]
MKSQFVLRFILLMLLFFGSGSSLLVAAETQVEVDVLLEYAKQYVDSAPEKSVAVLDQLKKLESTFTNKQKELFYFHSAASLALRGKHKERVVLVESFLNQVTNPNIRVKFLYQLSDAYTNLGEYENALAVMNQAIILLPKLDDLGAKNNALQAAISFYNSLHAYDEAMVYADRMSELEGDAVNSLSKCYGLANRIEIYFLRGANAQARLLMPEAMAACDANDHKIITLIVKALNVIDLVNAEYSDRDINAGLSILMDFSRINQTSDYVTQLEDAIANAYLKKGNFSSAERYAFQAYKRAKSENIVQLMEKTSETMAAIKREQGQLKSSLEYYDINLALKKKVLDDQLHKNLAYQRVKFDMQDKANELALSEQKNKTLTIEKALQQGKNQNLLLLMTLGLILLTILGAWLVRTLRQKNIFRTSAQIDGLTLVSNRAHFMDCATQAFKNSDGHASVVLFDMDHFKKINDTFGHAAGDWVLKTVCDTVKMHLRKTDIFGRLGGEEFAISLSGINQEEVLILAERCRAAIAEIDSNPCGFRFLITASFGLATRGIRGHMNFEETLAGADKALYFSKNEGRNRVSVFQ